MLQNQVSSSFKNILCDQNSNKNVVNCNYPRNNDLQNIPSTSHYRVRNNTKVGNELIPKTENKIQNPMPFKTKSFLDQPSTSGFNYQSNRQPLKSIQNQNIPANRNNYYHSQNTKYSRNIAHPYSQPSSSRQPRRYVDENFPYPQNRPQNAVQNNLGNEHPKSSASMWRPW